MKLILLASAVCCLASAQENLTGNWVAVLSRFDQKGYERLHIEQAGDTLKATSGPISLTGSFRGGELNLESSDGHAKLSARLSEGEIRGKALRDGEQLEFSARREALRSGPPKVHTFAPTEFHRVFTAAARPALHIQPGDTVKTWTVDSGGNDAAGRNLWNGGNPQTGPFYVEGALPGDTLLVKLNRLALNRDTAGSGDRVVASALEPNYNARLERVKDFHSEWILDREHGIARLKQPTQKLKDFTVPLRPMLGCVGVAPRDGISLRTGFLGAFGGNMDYNEVREGVTLYLPVFQPGALLFIGDGHAAQGDGELTGDALETSMDVEFTVDVIPNGARGQSAPRLENDEYVMAMGIAGSLTEALQAATTELSRWLTRDYALNPSEVAMVLGSSMRYDIAEVVDPYVNLVAKVRKDALARIAKK